MNEHTDDRTASHGGPETPRPGRSFQGPAHPADDQPISGLARRVGPPVVAVALAVTFALVAWMAIAPTAVEGPIEEAPFAVPATLLLFDDGCVTLVDGDGSTRTHCDDAWGDEVTDRHVEAYFDARGRLLVGEHPTLAVVDPDTGAVLDTVDVTDDPDAERGRPLPETRTVYPHDDRILVTGDAADHAWDPEHDEVLLDLDGPWGYDVTDAVLSPDGAWVLARTSRSQVVVAPTDGSHPPYEWVDAPSDRWIDLRSQVRWDG